MGIGDVEKLAGQLKVSAAEQREHEANLWAKRVVQIPLNMQEFFAISREDGQPDYAGYAAPGLAEGTDGWLLFKYHYTGEGFMDKKQVNQGGNWTNRENEDYT